MPNIFQQALGESSERGRGSIFASYLSGSSKKGVPSLPDLRKTAAELERIRRETGAPGIEQDSPGMMRRIVDILSRPNYAVAGFADQLLQGQSVSSAVGRAINEFFSGIPGLSGQKEAWGKVLEDAGVGTKTLADLFPFLEGTWVGAAGSRGAAGLALDIVTDPLTYLTFGGKTGFSVMTKAGEKFLSKAGRVRFGEHAAHMERVYAAAGQRMNDDAWEAASDMFIKETVDAVSGKVLAGAESMFAVGGTRFMGKHIPGTEKIIPVVGKKLYNAVRRMPGGEHAIEGAVNLDAGFRSVFSAFEKLVPLSKGMRSRATALHRKATASAMAHRGRLFAQWDDLSRQYEKLAKKDPDLGKKFYEHREGAARHEFTVEQHQVYDGIVGMYDDMLKVGRETGILGDEQFVKNYFAHHYENIEDFNEIWAAFSGELPPGAMPRFTKERPFLTYEEAKDISKRLHDIGTALEDRTGRARRLYPQLEPSYDVMDNLRHYIQNHSDLLARKAWTEEAVAIFGKEVDDAFDINVLYDLQKPLTGKQEEIRQRLLSVKSREELASVQRAFMDSPDDFPNYRPVRDGDVEPVLREHYGEGAKYVTRTGGPNSFWAEDGKAVLIPKAIADDIENVNSSLINTRDHAAFRKVLRGFDRVNNLFKLGVYTIWPASATRDAYSNVALSMLDIGLGAIDPKMHRATIGLLANADGAIRLGGIEYSYKQLRKMARDMNVWVPGEVFVEATGGGVGIGRGLKKAARARGLVENEARVQLWINNMRRGMAPRDAADRVASFLFNYGEVSRVEQELFRRLIPFYTFTRKNIQLQAKALTRTPGLVINQLKPFRGTKDENESLVKWEAEGLKIRLDRDGKTVHMLNGIDLPLRNLDVLWGGSAGRTLRQQMGMITPLLKTIPELALNRDFFLGRDLTRTQSGAVGRMIEALPTPKGVKDWLGYQKETDAAGRPMYTFDGKRFTLLFRSWMASRAISTADRQFRDYAQSGDWSAMALDLLTGIREKEIDLDEQMRRRLNERIRMLEESLQRRGVMREFKKSYVPKGT